MAKLRHIAMQVPDLEKAAKFYETVFEMKRVAHGHTPFGDALMLSDGVINMALLNFPEGTKGQLNGPDWAGLHHIGFVVDSEEETAKAIEANGGEYFTKLPEGIPGLQAETKYKDPNGLVFDISEHGWSTSPSKRAKEKV